MNKTFDSLPYGEYILKIHAEALSDTTISLYGNHRQFLISNLALKKGEAIDKEIALALKEADFLKQDNYRDHEINLFWEGDADFSFELTKADVPTVFTIGDSTVCNQEFSGAAPLYRCGGWGQALGMYLGREFAVSNHAEQGTHTQNCLDLHFKKVLEQLKEGDKVICQFGHNDQKQQYLDAFGGYYNNLITLGKAVREKGAEFIICSPIQRLIYVDGKLNTYLDSWRDAAKKASEDLGCKYIDLHTFTSKKYIELGDAAENLFFHSPELDRTHPNDFGAVLIAEYVAENLKED